MNPRDDDETQYIPRDPGYNSREPYRDEDFGDNATRYDGAVPQEKPRPQQHFPSAQEQYPTEYDGGYDQNYGNYDQQYQRYAQETPPQPEARTQQSSGGMSMGAVVAMVLGGIVIAGIIFFLLGRGTASVSTPEPVTHTQVSTTVQTTTVTEKPTELPSFELPSIDMPTPPQNLDSEGFRNWLNNLLNGKTTGQPAQ
ncbi:hypothetical protein GP475_02035 [Corynebacterium poyangense]|uniref:Uncharacterized protein n=1 Tax=Corynebacterium poyangense TaxID=2684405 RepID=A0A7H0SLX5_9CORY|nr:hypothetical protein [Corynebacterium poyangense]MBZ8177657.1 hypothetical protein [Corynebacterium poyangense]QNQ89550.1 hypothetical protein GP475_02035 [Corynebacterium poyangense]